MAQKTKTFYMRFYSTEPFGGNDLGLNNLLLQYADKSGKIVTPLIQIDDFAYRIVISANNNLVGENSLSGYFATYREEAITKAKKSTGDETILSLNQDEAIVEKSYFSLFYGSSSEVFIFQNARYGRINDLRSYLNRLCTSLKKDGGIALAEIGSEEFDIKKILNQKPQYIEYRIAKPKKYDTEDMPKWEQHQFEMMDEMGARAFTAKLSTRASGGLNKSATSRLIEELRESENIRKCKIKLEDIDSPIDLLTNVLKADFSVDLSSNGTINEHFIFAKIRDLKDKLAILKNYL